MTDAGPQPDAPGRGSVPAIPGDCPFCQRLAAHHGLIAATSLCAAFYDTTPLNPGHALVVPRRHEPDFLALTGDEHGDIMRTAAELRALLDQRYRPDGFNLGVNVGDAAGQTIAHAHLHLIPRFTGDVPEPRGGIRWLIPERAPYWDTKP